MSDYQQRLDFALAQTYNLNSDVRSTDGHIRSELRITLDEMGRPVELMNGHAPVDGFALVRRMQMAYSQIKRLEAGIATHRRLLGDAMQRAEELLP